MILEELPLWMNVAVFAAAAGVVWFAGTRVARYADRIQSATGAGEALLGMLLLGMITALPETAVALTASWSGNAELAVNNLIGGMALNVAILAAADAAVKGETLSAAVASRTPLLQGVLLILLLAVVAAATLGQGASLLGIGLWSWLILALYLGSLVLVRRWDARANLGAQRRARERAALGRLAGKTALGASAILIAGYALARTGDALAQQTGLGSSFFGAVFLALATSLPEITLAFSAVRLGRYAMAMGNIFGANLLGLALLFLVDAAYREGPVLTAAGGFATFAALLGIAVTALFLIGLLERGHRMVLRMGVDSLLVLATYGGGIAVLYHLR